MTVEIYIDKISRPWIINFGSIADPFDNKKLALLRERNKQMRTERTVEGNVKMFLISKEQPTLLRT